MALQVPFPYFGGKSRVASLVWPRFGDVRNYVEPFFGSGAMLLARPDPQGIETANDVDGMVANFWRAVASDAESVARWADNPVNENDLHARHSWLVDRKPSLVSRLEGDPDFYDAKIAGWWCWGLCCWIGSGWCSGRGPWHVVNGKLVHLGDAGQGVNRNLVHLWRGRGVNATRAKLYSWFAALQERMRRVRVCCGDWTRVLGPSPTTRIGTTAVFLDPPYADTAGRSDDLYTHDSSSVAHTVREWAIAHGDDPRLRISLCGYEGEHVMPDTWECVAWKALGGYAGQSAKDNVNARRERVWFSPHCIRPGGDRQASLF